MSDLELKNIVGGATLSGTLINSISKLITTLLDLGRAVGSSLYYWKNGKSCKL